MHISSLFKTKASKALFFSLSPLWFSPIAFCLMLLENATSVGGFSSVGRGWLVFGILIFCVIGLLLAALFYLIVIFVKERPINQNPDRLKIYTSLSVFLLYLIALSGFLGGGMDAFKVTIYIIVLLGLWGLGKYPINKVRNRR
ncbi:hypothetical protein [Colwellia psychrerythraea]|uniref:Uncharacterized protein n=1 Tax=Colwellia psychrerythraea TaxID=28229 RepID=A0A099KW49_COLPS|nr:hypothetical protein [Colwellia psychrerythraea]KGJ93878.1 hypothetical protein GAB14E_2433 [Colwellia psychrerythraea]